MIDYALFDVSRTLLITGSQHQLGRHDDQVDLDQFAPQVSEDKPESKLAFRLNSNKYGFTVLCLSEAYDEDHS